MLSLKKDGTPRKERKDKGVPRGSNPNYTYHPGSQIRLSANHDPRKVMSANPLVNKIARPTDRRLVNIERKYQGPIAAQALNHIEHGIHLLLAHGPPPPDKPKNIREKKGPNQTIYNKDGSERKTNAYTEFVSKNTTEVLKKRGYDFTGNPQGRISFLSQEWQGAKAAAADKGKTILKPPTIRINGR